ncbi:MAG TPA: MBL fold metallo-hydrolase [Erysipelotrichaceae bacterium]|nr:MBL fold metallo-hydrolase [Erysipelotrichaceae bacterium]
MYFHIIASGSKGNATIVASSNTAILIDMGISLMRLKKGLQEINLKVSDIKAAIFTHDHCDHISGIKHLSPKIMYALEGTLPSSLSHVLELNKPFFVGDLEITPFAVSHDAANPCGYLIKDKDESLVYMTDTGVFVHDNLSLIKNPTYLIIEANHDVKMLLNTDRTYELKNRIMSDVGHLCNEDSAMASISIIGDKTKEIVLAHLSEEANTPELALKAYEKIFTHFHINKDKYVIKCAHQCIPITGGRYPNED